MLAFPIVASCASDPADFDPSGPEVYETSAASLSERTIRAEINGTVARIVFPVEKRGSDAVEGTLRAKLINLATPENKVLGEAHIDIRQSDAKATHVLEVGGLEPSLARPDAAPIAIDWSLGVDGSASLHGKKSLYAALGKIEIEVRGATEVPAGGTAPIRVIARDPDALTGLADADVTIVLKGADGGADRELFAGKTNERGELLARLGLPDGVQSGQARVTVKAESAESWVETSVRRVEDARLHLSFDKTIYKPGQDVQLRLLALETGAKTPLADREVKLEALDAKGNKVWKKRLRTDAYGVVSASVPTASEINEGPWTFRAEVDALRAEKKIPIVRYNLPKMKVAVSADREFALLGDTIAGRVSARYLFGAPVANANVSLAVNTKSGSSITTLSGQTDAEGTWRYTFDVPRAVGVAIAEGTEALALSATIVDTAQQSEVGGLGLPLVEAPIVMRVVPETNALLPGAENVVYVTVSDPVGRPLSAEVKINGIGSEQTVSTGADGLAEVHFTPGADKQSVSLSLVAKDGAGRTHARGLDLAAQGNSAIVVRTDKAVYRAGEKATIRLLGPKTAKRAYIDVFRGAEGVKSLDVELTDGAATLELPIDRELEGLIAIDAFGLGMSGQLVRGAARVLVDPSDRLAIELSASKATYAPGEEAALTVKVTNDSGAPKVASVGLNVVDEAAFALGGEPTDTDLRVFMNVDSKLLPPEVSVLGRSAPSLFSESGEQRERVARVMFASAPAVPGPSLEHNSIREEIPRVVSWLNGRVQRDAIEVLKGVMSFAKENQNKQQEVGDLIKRRASWKVDGFGQFYKPQVTPEQQLLKLTSNGPDEVAGTPDDVSQDVYYSFIFWADEDDVDPANGWGRGGGWAENDVAFDGAGGPVPGPQAPQAGTAGPDPQAKSEDGGGDGGPRVRADFRETIFSNPSVITDSTGRATLRFPVADSITAWRASAIGSTQDGKLGSARLGFRTFQEFFIDFDVPVTLTRGDVVELPAIVYNYLQTPQTVTVSLEPDDWYQVESQASLSVALEPGEVRRAPFKIRVLKAGARALRLTATAGQLGDALVRDAMIMPDGVKEDQSFSDKINGAKDHVISMPADAIEGGSKVELVLSPGFAGEAVQGTEALLQEPSGCFEQTTSTAWPNTITTTYLDVTGQLTPELREKSIGLVTRGYQRLLTFESPTGGFNWWGDNDPGNRILSAIMLWHLKDLEKLIETDEAVRTRTLEWLVAQQRSDGSWPSGDALHAGNETLGTSDVRTTAFIAWALAHTEWADPAVEKAAGYLRSHQPEAADLYANALAANALAKIDPAGSATMQLLSRLDSMKQPAGEGKVLWPVGEQASWTGARGDVAALETTSLVAYGLMNANAYPENVNGALRFLVSNKDSVGSWYNTQATMNSLRALLAAASPRGTEADGTLRVTVNGQALAPVAITTEDGDVYRAIDLTSAVRNGDNNVRVEFTGNGDLTYRLSRRAYRPRATLVQSPELTLSVGYATTEVGVGQEVRANVQARYNGQGTRDQVLVRVGRAPGMTPKVEDLERIVSEGRASRYELGASEVVFYAMNMQSGVSRDLSFGMVATLPVVAEAPTSAVYVYYEPTIRTEVGPITFTVR